MMGNLAGIATLDHEPAQRSVRNQGGRADGISGFFIIVMVIAGRGVTGSSGLFADDREPIWRVAEENVRNFFHQRCAISLLAVSRIKDHQFPPVRERPRASAA